MPTRSIDVLRDFAPPVPDAVARRAAWPEPGGVRPARPSASVVLLRDGAGEADRGGVEVYLMHRHARMPFAPLMAVFPGGKVDPVDRPGGAGATRACAVREVAEETGVLVAASVLQPWAHWVTPEVEPLRFDTVFFVAAMPADQQARDVSGETDRAGWEPVVTALRQRERGRISLMPPTWSILLELARYADVAAVLTAATDRTIDVVLPRLIPTDSGWVYGYPS